jgi:diguanylate cyclase (GGDEF)-like protein/PAS domain S-box-containing protein
MASAKYRKILRPVLGIAVPTVLVTATLLVRLALARRFGPVLPAFTLFYLPVLFAALLFGFWAGLLATLLATVMAATWIFPPIGHLKVESSKDAISLAFFFCVGSIMSAMAEGYRRNQVKIGVLEKQQALRESRAKLETALESMSDAVFISNAVGAIVDFNSAFATFHKFSSKSACPSNSSEFRALLEFCTADGEQVSWHEWPVLRALRGETVANAEYRLRRTDTGETWIGCYNFSPIRDSDGTVIGSVVVARDISDQKRAEYTLRASETRYRTAFQTSLDAIAITRMRDGMYIDVNETFVETTGYERHEVIGQSSLALGLWSDPQDRENLMEILRQRSSCRDFQARFTKKDRGLFWVLLSVSIIEIDGETCALSIIRDISEAMSAEDEIRHLAFFDPLTGLANRQLLIEQLKKSVALGANSHRKRALLLVDLDNFKSLNDSVGHHIGDLLLQEVAQRVNSCVREVDTVGRLGGDEFAVLLEDLSETSEEAAAHALIIAEKILADVDHPYRLDGHDCASTCSIGITVFGDEHESVSEVLQQADIAMYQAKAAGRNSARFFAPGLQAVVSAHAAMEEALRRAIKNNEFELYYQPQLERGRLISAEALLRWNHPTLGILLPGSFIPLAEETRLIVPLGNWVLESACGQIAAWSDRPRTANLTLAVNISAVQLRKQEFVDSVLAALDRTGANPRNLRLEITESMLVTDVEEVIAKMNLLKSHGLGFSLDDFGTGYSSLSYLRRLPVDQLKIDRSFVRDINMDPASRVIAETIISLSKAMDLPVMAEGVETLEQKTLLEGLGCHSFQGYLFSEPLRLHEFEQFIVEFREAVETPYSNVRST